MKNFVVTGTNRRCSAELATTSQHKALMKASLVREENS